MPSDPFPRPLSIRAVNELAPEIQRSIYLPLIPRPLLLRFQLDPCTGETMQGEAVLRLIAKPGTNQAILELWDRPGAEVPVIFLVIGDTPNQELEVRLLQMNDPCGPYFAIQIDPAGSPTKFGTVRRNVDEEVRALRAGLAPGQSRPGLGLYRDVMDLFEHFVTWMGHSLWLIQPLAYHNAIQAERNGFGYIAGRRLMDEFHRRFQPGGDLSARLDGSAPFRHPEAAYTVRGRSWAIHDGILGEPFPTLRMYRQIGRDAGADTFPGGRW